MRSASKSASASAIAVTLVLVADRPAGHKAVRVHVVKDGAQTVAGSHAGAIDVACQRLEASRQGRSEDVDLRRLIDERADRLRNLVRLGQVLVGDHEHAVSSRNALRFGRDPRRVTDGSRCGCHASDDRALG